ncbi:hypothetical protein DYB32_002619 [Aphanomyces invadans]|uniref:Uncharacterized protein n=1 Tax=Aphanomyces invadans TaxID=157072 RepID=A0A3R6YCP3_9STRA|nr:hypothetical protein DYB32_002619 [Aphanomyces invadans]
MASPHASSILYTSRGDVTVNVLDNNYLSSEARDYFAEVTDVSSENVHDDDLVTLRRADFDAMMGFVAKHLREIPPSIVVSATSHSIAPGTSLETMLSELAATDQANTPLSQIILLVDGSDDHATPSNDGSTSGASDAPSSSAAREMVRSFQRSRGVPPASRTTASSCRRCDEWNTMPPMTTLVPVMVRHGSPGTNPANKTKPTSPPTSHPRRIWESLFGKTAFENNADLDQSYFVFH